MGAWQEPQTIRLNDPGGRQTMRKPDFFIVGAPKCGTTALYAYLKEHPEVFMAKKERHYFGRDLRPPHYPGPHSIDEQWYLDFFREVTTQKRVGEASVWYLWSETAAQEIKAFNPEADIIIMLRNPATMMPSLYNMFLWVGDPTPAGVIDEGTRRVLSLEEALDTQEARKAAYIHRFRSGTELFDREFRYFHTDAALYTTYVQRYLEVFGPDHVHVILYDDFKSDLPRIYREVLLFLGVDPDFQPEFRVVNSRRNIRNVFLNRFLRRPDSFKTLRRVLRVLAPRPVRAWVGRFLMRRNVQPQESPPLLPETRARLETYFRPEIERLGILLNRDLTTLWLGDTAPVRTQPPEHEMADSSERTARNGHAL
jgi:hypothetical protein